MKTTLTLFLLIFFNNLSAQPEARFVKNQLLVKIAENRYDAEKVDLVARKFGISELDDLNSELHLSKMQQIGLHQLTHTFLLEFATDVDVVSVAQRFKATGVLVYAEPNYIGHSGGERAAIIPNDTRFNKQWGLYNPGTQTGIGNVTPDADVDMELAWDIETGDPDMIIAVSDSGVRMTHPDLAARIWSNTAEVVNGIDDDGNGLIDDVNGWDWVNNDNLPADDLGHGTNTTGIIGAIANNNNLFTGANWNSKMMVLKVLDSDNSATYAAMASSIYCRR